SRTPSTSSRVTRRSTCSTCSARLAASRIALRWRVACPLRPIVRALPWIVNRLFPSECAIPGARNSRRRASEFDRWVRNAELRSVAEPWRRISETVENHFERPDELAVANELERRARARRRPRDAVVQLVDIGHLDAAEAHDHVAFAHPRGRG